MNINIQNIQQIPNWIKVWALTRTYFDLNYLFLALVVCLEVLKGEPPPWPHVFWRIEQFFPQHDAATTVLHSEDGEFKVMSGVSLQPHFDLPFNKDKTIGLPSQSVSLVLVGFNLCLGIFSFKVSKFKIFL